MTGELAPLGIRSVAIGPEPIVDLANRDDLPERIQLGANAFEDIAAKLARTASDQETWRTVSLSADFDS